jgi:small-conductance mechanosensitive channel
MRLKSAFRLAFYGIFAALFVSGAVWLLADQMKNQMDGNSELWQQTASYLLTLHGGSAMVALMFLGAMWPMHIQRAWRAKTNRVTGIASIATYGLLVVTAFGLYYLGSEALRPWISYIHIAFGLAIPAVIIAHIKVGRASLATTTRKVRVRGATAPTLVPDDAGAVVALSNVT